MRAKTRQSRALAGAIIFGLIAVLLLLIRVFRTVVLQWI